MPKSWPKVGLASLDQGMGIGKCIYGPVKQNARLDWRRKLVQLFAFDKVSDKIAHQDILVVKRKVGVR